MGTTLKNAISKRDHFLGDPAATLQLLEYGDYQCSSCGDAYLAVRGTLDELGANVVFIFRHFPLTESHPNAFDAALAAEAASLQNKFWEMHELLFQNQARLSGHYLFVYARAIGLDMERFKRDVQSTVLASKIEEEMNDGLRSGVNGTPAFYINGEQYNGEWDGGGLSHFLKNLLP